jgi:hypothetical protein
MLAPRSLLALLRPSVLPLCRRPRRQHVLRLAMLAALSGGAEWRR